LYPHAIPTKSPFGDSLQTLNTIVPDSIVDWIIINLKFKVSGVVKASQNSLLSKNGFICNLQGGKGIQMSIIKVNYYISMEHRNHIGTQRVNAVTLGGTLVFYDFTNSLSKYYGLDAKAIETGKYEMYSGDVDDSGTNDEIDSDE
jgi:hypothetical protein